MRFFLKRDHLWKFRTAPFDLDQVDSLITYLILGVIFGGRAGYVFFYNFQFYLENPVDILRVWDGGMSFHGGFLGVVIAAYFFCKFNGVPILSGADLIAISTPPGLFLGRVANFINAELWGRPTDFVLGVVFPGMRAQDCPDIIGVCARHPSQLYEAVLEGVLLLGILIFLALRGFFKKPGFITGVFLFGYGTSRYFVEFFREADAQFVTPDNQNGYVLFIGEFGVSMGQLLSMPMIFVGLIMLNLTLFNKGKVNV